MSSAGPGRPRQWRRGSWRRRRRPRPDVEGPAGLARSGARGCRRRRSPRGGGGRSRAGPRSGPACGGGRPGRWVPGPRARGRARPGRWGPGRPPPGWPRPPRSVAGGRPPPASPVAARAPPVVVAAEPEGGATLTRALEQIVGNLGHHASGEVLRGPGHSRPASCVRDQAADAPSSTGLRPTTAGPRARPVPMCFGRGCRARPQIEARLVDHRHRTHRSRCPITRWQVTVGRSIVIVFTKSPVTQTPRR